MKIVDDLLSTLDYAAPVREIRQGPFQTAVFTRYCGVASTPHDVGPHHDKSPVKEAGLLLNQDTVKLAHMALSPSPLEASIGMAAVNSLIEVDERLCTELNAADLVLGKGKDKRIAIVGHFPFISKVRETAKQLWVIEKNPREGDFIEADADNLIPRADVIGITGAAFTNHTIEHMLELCNPRAYVIVLGDTSPLSQVLFDYGVDAISGTKVVNPEQALRCVSEGANFRQIKGTRRLTMMR